MRRTLRSSITRQRVFGRESPVLDYWVGHSEGFRLTTPDGRGRGDVERVVVDEHGRPRALVVRSAVLRRPQLLDVRAVQAVVPATKTITLRGAPRRPPRPHAARKAAPLAARALGAVVQATVAVFVLAWSAVRWSAGWLRRHAPVAARRLGHAAAAAAIWAGPRARTLARLGASAVVTVMLVLLALVRALVVGIVASGGLVAREWKRQRAGRSRSRMSTARR